MAPPRKRAPRKADLLASTSVAPLTAQEVIQSRESTHGDYGIQSMMAQNLKTIFRNEPGWASLSLDQRESMDMILVKISRIFNGDSNNPDHWLDLGGYATLCYNRLTSGNPLGTPPVA